MLEQIIHEATDYLNNVHPYFHKTIDTFSDDKILMEVNRLYFGGLQSFARHVNKKKGSVKGTSLPIHDS